MEKKTFGRPGCTASCLASAPLWAWPALVRARQLLRDAAEVGQVPVTNIAMVETVWKNMEKTMGKW